MEKMVVKSDKMVNGKVVVIDFVCSYWWEKKCVMRISDFDVSNIEVLGLVLFEFDEDDWKLNIRVKMDLKVLGICVICKLNFF